jgi:hypothetical protein
VKLVGRGFTESDPALAQRLNPVKVQLLRSSGNKPRPFCRSKLPATQRTIERLSRSADRLIGGSRSSVAHPNGAGGARRELLLRSRETNDAICGSVGATTWYTANALPPVEATPMNILQRRSGKDTFGSTEFSPMTGATAIGRS